MQNEVIPRITKSLGNNKRIHAAMALNVIIAGWCFVFASTSALAQAAKYGIISPTDGATVSTTQGLEIQFDFRNEEKAQHVHLFIDDTQVGMAHKAYGQITAGPLSAGKRRICLGPVNANHTPIGERSCINVLVE